MPEIGALGGGWATQYGSVPGSSIGTTVTASASADTKGTVVELTAATDHDAHWVSVTIVVGATAGLTGLLSLLIGSSTEADLIANLPVTARAANEGGGGPYLFPLFVPKGSRLAASYQNSTGSATVEVVVHLFGGSPLGPYADCAYVDRYGATTTSRGTNVDPGGSVDTYSAWSAIANTTLRPIRWLVVAWQNVDTSFFNSTLWTLQVGIGSATEQVIAGDFLVHAGSTVDASMPFMQVYLPIFIPAGSIVSVRAKCNSTTDGDRDLYVSLFGCG